MSKVEIDNRLLKPGVYFMRGNDASVEGALIAGCRFFAGYPITPSNEIATLMSRRLPQVGGIYMQFEDEIGSIMAVLGASNGGVKSMTATSGPGFSLMQEAIGLAAMTETPAVIVEVQRGGPSTGLPTQVGQGDVMQVKWGSHGDYEIVAYLPNSPQEMFDMTIKAFNTAWRYRVPVVVLSDQMIGHMREKVVVPPYEEIEIVERRRPEESPEEFLPFSNKYLIPPMAVAGEGYRIHVTGLAHNEKGYPTTDYETVRKLVTRLVRKIRDNERDIAEYEEFMADDAKLIIVSFGITSRSAKKAVRDARSKGLKVGLFRPKTAWPFPYWRLQELTNNGADVLVVEINMGQMYRVVREHVRSSEVYNMPLTPGACPSPEDIYKKIEEVYPR
jgi:2-oxoglutarate ferredoxin oxidoreductase subunit alpha